MLVQRPLAAVSNTMGLFQIASLCTRENLALLPSSLGCLVSSLCSVAFPQPIRTWDQV